MQDVVNSYTVDGAVEFTQSLLTGSNSHYTIWLRGDNMAGKNYEVGLADDCAGTNYVVRCIVQASVAIS